MTCWLSQIEHTRVSPIDALLIINWLRDGNRPYERRFDVIRERHPWENNSEQEETEEGDA